MTITYKEQRERKILEVYSKNRNIFKLNLSEYSFKNPVAALTFFSFENQVTLNTLTGRSVCRKDSDIRRDAMVFMFCVCPDYSVVELARLFDRDHTTMLYAIGDSVATHKRYPSKQGKVKQKGIPIFLDLGSVSYSGNGSQVNQVSASRLLSAAE